MFLEPAGALYGLLCGFPGVFSGVGKYAGQSGIREVFYCVYGF